MANCLPPGYLTKALFPVKKHFSVDVVKERFADTNKIQAITLAFLRFAKSEQFDITQFLESVDNIYGDFNDDVRLKYWACHHACCAYAELAKIDVIELPTLETLLLGFHTRERELALQADPLYKGPTDFAWKLASLVRASKWKEL